MFFYLQTSVFANVGGVKCTLLLSIQTRPEGAPSYINDCGTDQVVSIENLPPRTVAFTPTQLKKFELLVKSKLAAIRKAPSVECESNAGFVIRSVWDKDPLVFNSCQKASIDLYGRQLSEMLRFAYFK